MALPLVEVVHGDALTQLRLLPAASVDAVITDPPYELGFMGKSWDAAGIAYSVELWAECLRVLRPGGHLAAFGGSRTYHRMACAVEDAGFEIRDSLQWIYGSGFPKSHDVSKAIDKAAGAEREIVGPGINYAAKVKHGGTWTGDIYAQGAYTGADGPVVTAPATDAARTWAGWGTALKPAVEPIVLARKPLQGTVAANTLAYGVGGLNIDATRVAHGADVDLSAVQRQAVGEDNGWRLAKTMVGAEVPMYKPEGRWPANVLLTHSPECDGVCVAGCPVAELDTQSGTSKGHISMRGDGIGKGYGSSDAAWNNRRGFVDQGGASRFFPTFRYQAKAPRSERPKVDGVSHPTVKPLALMQWLVRLLCPPGGTVLEPFAGSGTTVEACIDEGMSVIGIEREAEYLPHIQVRIDRALARQTPPPAGDSLALFEVG